MIGGSDCRHQHRARRGKAPVFVNAVCDGPSSPSGPSDCWSSWSRWLPRRGSQQGAGAHRRWLG